MHKPRATSVAYFDFSGSVEISVTCNQEEVDSVRIRPRSHGIEPVVTNNTITFTLTEPKNLSIEINGNIFNNLHLFAGPIEPKLSESKDPDVIYFGPGVHAPGDKLHIPSGKTVYLAGGAVLKTTLVCDKVENVRIIGRGVLYHGERGIEISHSRNIEIDGITVMNPRHYTVSGGQSQQISIRNLKSFSSKGWSDGIDLMSCSQVRIDGVFMRNSDDCIAIYGHRWEYTGDASDIFVCNSVLWADVAHPVNIGTHGNPAAPEVLEKLTFRNIDILNHDEPQIGYQGCFAINASDSNLVRDVLIEDIRIEDFEQGQLFNFRVAFNKKYATAPGRGIQDVLVKNVSYEGNNANISIITGYDEARAVKNVVFENLRINDQFIKDADMGRFHVGEHVEGLEFRITGK